MSRRPSLDELRRQVLLLLDGNEWRTPSQVCDLLGVGHGRDWDRVALILERLAADGQAKLKATGGRIRRFRAA